VKKLSTRAIAPPVPGLVKAARDSINRKLKRNQQDKGNDDNLSKELFNRGEDTWGFAAAAAGNAVAPEGPLAVPPQDDKPKKQLKDLYDGLSHLFAAPSQSRVRPVVTSAQPVVTNARPVLTSTPPKKKKSGLTPSRLVKTAAGKQLEERRRVLNEGERGNPPCVHLSFHSRLLHPELGGLRGCSPLCI